MPLPMPPLPVSVPMFDESGDASDITRIEFRFVAGQWRWSMWSGVLPVSEHDVPPERLDDVLRATRLTLHSMAGFPVGAAVFEPGCS